MKKHMRLAIEKAIDGVRNGESPFGSCIVKGGKVISVEHNTVLSRNDPTDHAEISAIRAACRELKTHDLSGCTIYSTTEPCPMCFSAIHWAKMNHIVFGTRIKDVQDLGFSELTIDNNDMKKRGGSKLKITGDFLREECLELLIAWKNGGGKTY
ncbi:MAG: nucleoside deaminase [Candidatus Micrarchaeota archaeon]